ncbi:MAG: hypothetical protein WKF76_11315 [Nocardioidaceae bacterium]
MADVVFTVAVCFAGARLVAVFFVVAFLAVAEPVVFFCVDFLAVVFFVPVVVDARVSFGADPVPGVRPRPAASATARLTALIADDLLAAMGGISSTLVSPDSVPRG